MYTVSATAGAAVGLVDGRDAETLLHRSSLALARAKDSNRGWFAFFKTGMDELVRQRAMFESDLWAAVREGPDCAALPAAGQPAGLVACAAMKSSHAGRTLRADHSTDQFIPAAEASGAICDLTFNLLRKACKEAAGLGMATLHLLAQRIAGAAGRAGLCPEAAQDPGRRRI